MKTETRTDHLEVILRKMCEFVGADYSVVNSHENWYNDYEWTLEQNDEFADWMCEYLYTRHSARKQVMSFPAKNKTIIKKAVNFFLFMYGWKFKQQ